MKLFLFSYKDGEPFSLRFNLDCTYYQIDEKNSRSIFQKEEEEIDEE